ncbi:hypothetical protein BJP37_08440 [Moorena bouillonii PNG]|uniref:Uncharacterized protein n=1 Tax=Moorena bouillonii PNG TaxID=568701 RepID=A0A1U7MZD5_9CYAN|nr:hypothetical protein BJP37_08440 [Moorena bouillonii PNG]
MGGTTAVAHGGNPQDRAASPRPHWLPKTALHRFLTFFSQTSVGKIGHGDFSGIQRLCQHLDNLISKISKAKGKQKYRMRKAARRMVIRIQSLEVV